MLSVGTGLEPVRPLDPQSLEIGRSWVGSAMAIKSLGVVIVDQVYALKFIFSDAFLRYMETIRQLLNK